MKITTKRQRNPNYVELNAWAILSNTISLRKERTLEKLAKDKTPQILRIFIIRKFYVKNDRQIFHQTVWHLSQLIWKKKSAEYKIDVNSININARI